MPSPRRINPLRTLAFAGALGCAGLAFAEPTTEGDAAAPTPTTSTQDPMDVLLEAFASDNYVEREAASAALIALAPRDEVVIETLRTRELLPEQRERLVGILRDRFLRGSRPALGIRMQPNARGGIEIVDVVHDGFPASKFLRANDLIVRLGDIDFRINPSLDVLRRTILSYEPGETVRLLILRGENELELHVPLGSFDALNAPAQLSQADLFSAWEARASRLGLLRTVGRPIGMGGEALEVPVTVRPVLNRAQMRASRSAAPDWIVPGGEPAGSIERRLEGLANALAAGRTQQINERDGVIRIAEQGGAVIVEMRALQERNAEQGGAFQGLIQRIEELESRMAIDRVMLADPELAPAVREQIANRMRSNDELLSQLKSLVEAMGRAR